jgi:hypothetical protein
MKLTSLAFFVLLLFAHGVGDGDRLVPQPLSMLRDGPQGWVGFALFGLLLLVGLLYTAALARSRREAEAALSGLAALILLMVAVTPSGGSFHFQCSLALLLLLFAFFALLLYRAESFWLTAHLLVPAALALATGLQSYGLWQKAMIAYFVAVTVFHHHGLIRPPAGRLALAFGPGARRSAPPGKRRRIYQLGEGREWARRQVWDCPC